MTLHEIEETLHTLTSRHSGLDETMLVTLLRAGGWEERNIEEAKMLWRAQGIQSQESLSPLQEKPVFIPTVDVDHLLTSSKNTPLTVKEPESLVKTFSESKREELPHNLPLRPFETSEHVWPFSRYKDVFYGDIDTPNQVSTESQQEAPIVHTEVVRESVIQPAVQLQPTVEPEKIATQPVIVQIAKSSPVLTHPDEEKIDVHITPVPLSRGDEKLVILASVMLFAILLLLGYMYSNGRL